MAISDFKPYVFPIPSLAGWDRDLNVDQAKAYIAPRGVVTGFLIPKKSKRYILQSNQFGDRVYDRTGGRVIKLNDKIREVLNRLPENTIVDTYISNENVTIIDVLFYNGTDVRGQRLEERLGFYWYMPEEYRNRSFYNEHNSDKLSVDIFQGLFSKIIFKPDFVVYPRAASSRRVYNWLEMRAPKGNIIDAQPKASGNLGNLMLRRASTTGTTRSEEIR
jgi:hypothetical protein